MTIRNPELLEDLSQQGQQSVLVMLAHQGNWEWMLHRAAAQYDMPMAFVYKRLHSAAADEFSLRARGRFGASAIEMRETARNFIRHRRTPRLIYMLADQSPGARERVYVTHFLNRQTAFFSGAATLAKATGFPVAYARCRRLRRGYFDIELIEICRDPVEMGRTVFCSATRSSPRHRSGNAPMTGYGATVAGSIKYPPQLIMRARPPPAARASQNRNPEKPPESWPRDEPPHPPAQPKRARGYCSVG